MQLIGILESTVPIADWLRAGNMASVILAIVSHSAAMFQYPKMTQLAEIMFFLWVLVNFRTVRNPGVQAWPAKQLGRCSMNIKL